MTTQTSQVVVVTRNYNFAAEQVFDAWLEPAQARRFLFATPTGTMVRVEIDARVGGQFNFTRREDRDIEHVGTYLEIDHPRRLVFTFGVPKFSDQMTTVSIDIQHTPTGCELTLTHEGVLPDWAEKTREGWGNILDTLSFVMT